MKKEAIRNIERNKVKENNNGITLISLVITIIILIILAGIMLNLAIGQNGIFTKTKQAKREQLIATEKEQISIAYTKCEMDLVNTSKTRVTDNALHEELVKNKNDVNTTSTETGEGYFIYVTFNNTNNQYIVNENGNIIYVPDEDFDTSKIDEKLLVQTASFQDSLETIINPDRGWYKPVIVELEPNGFETAFSDIQERCARAINLDIQILHLRVNIGQLSGNVNTEGIDKEFSTAQLSSLNSMLDIIRKNNLNVIIRFSYDTDGEKGTEPKSFETIKKHVKQLSSFFEKNKDIISTVEAGFIGPWGEMHSSQQYQADNYYKELIETLLDSTPDEIKVNVRKPYLFKLVVGELNDSQHRLGIFNDGYLGSSTDLGTFDNGITRDEFVNWMQNQGQYTLYGGEATKSSTASQEDEQYSESSFAIEEMQKTHTSYLNNDFNKAILDTKWKNQTYTSSNSEYNGQTAYKYITDHLGYRMVVRNSKISSSVQKGDICGVNLEIENVGFGNIVKTQKVSVILRKKSTYYETTLNINASDIKSGKINNVNFYFYIPSDIEEGDWDIYLKLTNKDNSNYAVQFANSNMWNKNLQANKLGKVTIEETVAKEGVKIKQAFSYTASEGSKGLLNIEEEVETIPVRFVFYNASNGNTEISTVTKNLILGTDINFKDASSLSAIEISIPEGYAFTYAQCYAITGDWNAHDNITIPNETTEKSYWINVFVKEATTIPITFAYYANGEQVETIKVNIPLGTTIDFKDESNLSSLGITIPSGYEFNYAQCYKITEDWNAHDSITIPNETTESSYWINVFVK